MGQKNGQDCPIYTMYVNRKDLLLNALVSLGSYQCNVTVLDNSPAQNLELDGIDVEIIRPCVPLFCNQSYNLIQSLVRQRQQALFFIMHSDAQASPEIVTLMLERATQLQQEQRRWGVMFSNYDVLALYNTPVIQDFHWDPYLPLSYTDIDYYYRLKLAGIEIVETGLPVQHLEGGSTTLNADPALHIFVQTNYPAWRHYYILKWGGERDHELFTAPFNLPVPPNRNSALATERPILNQSALETTQYASSQLEGINVTFRRSMLDPLIVLDPLFQYLRPVYHTREVETQDRAWQLPERDYPISLTNEEGVILYETILQKDLTNGFEIATGFGISSLWAGLALRETGGRLMSLDCYIEEQHNRWNYTLDDTTRDLPTDEPLGLRFAKRVAAQLGLSQFVSYHIGVSPDDVSPLLAGQTIDYAFVDGLHYSGQPLRDFMALAPYLAPRCLVAFHSNQAGCDVPEAVRAAEHHLGTSAIVYPTRNSLTLIGRGLSLAKDSERPKGKIVIATHNGASVLPTLIGSLAQHGTGGYDLLIVDTGSDEPASLDYLAFLAEKGVPVAQTPYRGYDTGAYLWAFHHAPAENYLFLHDSLIVTASDWTERFQTRNGVAALAAFPFGYDNPDQRDWLLKQFPIAHIKIPERGLFGPIFATSHVVLEELDQCGFLTAIPLNKNEQQAMERGWAIAFASCGVAVRYLVENYMSLNSANVGLQKILVKRP